MKGVFEQQPGSFLSAIFKRLPFRICAARGCSDSHFKFPLFQHICFITLFLAIFLFFVFPAYAIPPSFRDAETATSGQVSTITITKPLALTGDVLIAVITVLSPNTGLTITPPSAEWSLIRQDIQGSLAQFLYYKVVSAAEPASYTFTNNQNRETAGAIASYWQVDTTSPIDAHGGQYNAGSPPTAPSVTTTTSNTTLVTILGTTDARDLTPPNAMIERWRAAGTNGNQGFDEIFAGPGATGTRTSATNTGSTIGQTIALRPASNISPGSSGTVLFVTANSGSTAALEQQRRDKLEYWGYSIQLIDQGADQTVYDAAIPLADIAYIPASVNSNTHRARLLNSCIGVVNEEGNLSDDLGFSSGVSRAASETSIEIPGNSHDITLPFVGSGVYPLFMTAQPLYSINSTIAPGATVLGARPGVGLIVDRASLFVIDTNDLLYGGNPAAARRVHLPWGTSQADLTQITATGDQLMKRSVEWASGNSSCDRSQLQKRSFLPDGTPLPDGSQLAAGTEIKFLIYINNQGSAISNINIADILDAAFIYVPNSIQIDNSLPACTSLTCTTAEEQAIFDAFNNAPIPPFLTDPVDTDIASNPLPSQTLVTVGSTGGNSQANVAANSVFALLFSVTLN